MAELLALMEVAGEGLTAENQDLLSSFTGAERFDIEAVLAALSHAAALVDQLATPLSLGGRPVKVDDVRGLRKRISSAVAQACNLPGPRERVADGLKDDPLMAHAAFVRRLAAVRRRGLERPWLFTTNYDVVLEKALDATSIPYIDGFMGTIVRRLTSQVYGHDLYVPRTVQDARMLRIPDLMYLVKVHGSVNWTVRDGEVRAQGDFADSDDPVVIYPSPLKESETLGYPYADLMRVFASTLARPDAALLTVGYGFADAHINRIIEDQFTENRSLQLLVTSPSSVGTLASTDEGKSVAFADTTIGAYAALADGRVSALGGEAAKFTRLALDVMPSPPSPQASSGEPL